ncbi:MAG TPA: enoyl-CoA hydratase/isomerase family protein [Steroidobacteraceae bacterium]|nr:enoyl-CoA hydratase/isomerase family protein [Steroidobacteraceae bacterium]
MPYDPLVEQAVLKQAKDLLIDPARGWSGASDSWQPLGFVDLHACPDNVRFEALPPFPVIGLGEPAHPLARALDAIVEPPVSVDALIRQTRRAPRAAAVAIQLLRSLEGLPCERALLLESFCYGLLQGSAEHEAWLASRVAPEPPAPAGRLVVERRDSVLHMLLDRPQARNAIDRSLRDQLVEAFTLAGLDSEVRSMQLRAVGTAFSIGGDLDEFGTTRDPATAHLIRSRTLPALALAGRAGILDVHVQGACVGAGLEIAAFAGRLTATSDAWFQLPELAMGLIPGAGGCVSVPGRIGRQRAGLMILSGRRINATTALRWGLIDAIEASPPGGGH